MKKSIGNITKKVVESSNTFENNNSDLKRRYLIRNIIAFNSIVLKVNSNRGSFGTGYPFYVLKPDLTGQLPIINEQIRYNNKLLEDLKNNEISTWVCAKCLSQNYNSMPDLKQQCKPCNNMKDGLKPRKIINRLPDIDMWMICEDGKLNEASKELAELAKKYNMKTSDVNPIQTIQDIEDITKDIKNGIMPKKLLPIDIHIIEYSKIRSLIELVPLILEQSLENKQIPNLPISPLSYRKTWQYDDEPYNFIHDFLSSLTVFNVSKELNQLLNNARTNIATNYTVEQLYEILIKTGPDSVKRRHETKGLRDSFEKRINSWNNRNKSDKGEEPWER